MTPRRSCGQPVSGQQFAVFTRVSAAPEHRLFGLQVLCARCAETVAADYVSGRLARTLPCGSWVEYDRKAETLRPADPPEGTSHTA